LSHQQREAYRDHEAQVSRLINIAKRRPLTKQEQEKLMRELAMMRMICDTNYILDREDRTSPKIEELESILQTCLTEPEVKVVLFSEWERMLELARDRLQRMRIGSLTVTSPGTPRDWSNGSRERGARISPGL
jgi:ERCC4-related helicase